MEPREPLQSALRRGPSQACSRGRAGTPAAAAPRGPGDHCSTWGRRGCHTEPWHPGLPPAHCGPGEVPWPLCYQVLAYLVESRGGDGSGRAGGNWETPALGRSSLVEKRALRLPTASHRDPPRGRDGGLAGGGGKELVLPSRCLPGLGEPQHPSWHEAGTQSKATRSTHCNGPWSLVVPEDPEIPREPSLLLPTAYLECGWVLCPHSPT